MDDRVSLVDDSLSLVDDRRIVFGRSVGGPSHVTNSRVRADPAVGYSVIVQHVAMRARAADFWLKPTGTLGLIQPRSWSSQNQSITLFVLLVSRRSAASLMDRNSSPLLRP